MNNDRRQLVLDHLHGLLTLQQVADKLNLSVQRAYQLKQQLLNAYRVPLDVSKSGPATARWIAARDLRNQAFRYTPQFFYEQERWQDQPGGYWR